MKLLVLIILLQSPSAKSHFGGTEPRQENEYKINFEINNTSIDSLTEKIQRSLFELLNSKKLNADRLLNSNYYLTGKLIPYCYLDYYFDTPDFQLFNNKMIYRLRYRWKTEKNFNEFSKFFRKKDHPIRAEIQAKTEISVTDEGYASSYESRFEFRKESSPFSKENPAPTSPWPVKTYLNYTTKGKFKKYNIIPYYEIKKRLTSNIELSPKVVIKTLRRRFHINLKNKWGNGPNPNQAYIITIDSFRYQNFENISKVYLDEYSKSFYEVEIEFERNTSTILALDTSPDAKIAKVYFKNDHDMIRKNLLETLVENSVNLSGENLSKYKKVILASRMLKKI